MNKLFACIPRILLLVSASNFGISLPQIAHSYSVDPVEQPYILFTDNKGLAVSEPQKGLEAKRVPAVNLFLHQPGCYISCHTHNPQQGAYVSSSQTYAIGVIRVKGQYENTVCVPTDLDTPDIRNDQDFRTLCSKTFMCIGNSCWANANTGDWFGLK